MRCRICDLPHKNTGNHQNWKEYQVCRNCFFFFEIFGMNSNYLGGYWN